MKHKADKIKNRFSTSRLAGQSTKGFSLVETLVALMILVLMTGMVAAGIPSAQRAYQKAVDGSNAQVLLSTAVTVLRDELSYATQIDPQPTPEAEVTVQSFVSGKGYWVRLKNNKTSLVEECFYGDTAPVASDPADTTTTLISDRAVTDALRIEYGPITYQNGIFTITDLRVTDSNGNTIAAIDEGGSTALLIRALMIEG